MRAVVDRGGQPAAKRATNYFWQATFKSLKIKKPEHLRQQGRWIAIIAEPDFNEEL